LATAPVDKNQYQGQIIYIDKENAVFYQQVNKDYIVHQLNAVDDKPVAGKDVAITYDGKKATLTLIDALKNKRSLKI
ncbi:MAG TPA: conjugal transfer protein TraO, partial [Nitrosomonas sp.]|nr:conjugal transfer protein TraO [Nitrosomonas sp.]HNH53024.1 conjugal transfer protein TraO [Nitrosomonas sp.]